jgi:hypothetical protein
MVQKPLGWHFATLPQPWASKGQESPSVLVLVDTMVDPAALWLGHNWGNSLVA